MLIASGPQAGQHGDNRAGNWCGGWTQSFARTRVRPEREGTMLRAGCGVKRSLAVAVLEMRVRFGFPRVQWM